MEKRGRKKGCTDIGAMAARRRLYDEYDRLRQEVKSQDELMIRYLPRMYYVERLYAMHIEAWSKSRIRRLLMYRYKDEDERK